LLLLAVADDAIGLLIIAIFYPDPNHPPQYLWLILVAVGMLAAFIMKKFGIKQWWLYLFIAGGFAWFGMFKCGMHPSLASVLIVPFIPNTEKMEEQLGTMAGEDDDDFKTPLGHCEHKISPFVDFGLIFFGISNSGVQFSEISNLTLIIYLSLLVGKTLGITLFSKFSVSVLKCELPKGMSMKEVLIAGLVASMGLTVALFISGSAFVDVGLQAAAKMGALFSASAFIIVPVWAKMIRIEKILHPKALDDIHLRE
jgi:NhaA family Na+:H+ antiporter